MGGGGWGLVLVLVMKLVVVVVVLVLVLSLALVLALVLVTERLEPDHVFVVTRPHSQHLACGDDDGPHQRADVLAPVVRRRGDAWCG